MIGRESNGRAVGNKRERKVGEKQELQNQCDPMRVSSERVLFFSLQQGLLHTCIFYLQVGSNCDAEDFLLENDCSDKNRQTVRVSLAMRRGESSVFLVFVVSFLSLIHI